MFLNKDNLVNKIFQSTISLGNTIQSGLCHHPQNLISQDLEISFHARSPKNKKWGKTSSYLIQDKCHWTLLLHPPEKAKLGCNETSFQNCVQMLFRNCRVLPAALGIELCRVLSEAVGALLEPPRAREPGWGSLHANSSQIGEGRARERRKAGGREASWLEKAKILVGLCAQGRDVLGSPPSAISASLCLSLFLSCSLSLIYFSLSLSSLSLCLSNCLSLYFSVSDLSFCVSVSLSFPTSPSL